MSTLRPRAAGLLIAVGAVLAGVASARAQAGAIPVHIDYRSTAGCAQPGAFAERLLSHDAHVRLASAGEPAPVLIARISRDARGTRGRLIVRDVDGNQSQREVEGDSCEAVLHALVLMSAMAVDPTASGGPPGATGAAEADAASAAAPGAGGGEHPEVEDAGASEERAAEASAPASSPATPDAGAAEAPEVSEPARDLREGWHASVAGGAGLESGVSPSVVLAFAGSLEVARSTGGIWSPSVRAGFEHADSGDQAVSGGGVHMVKDAGSLDLCPLRWSAGGLRVTPCLRAETGALQASGLGVTPTRSDTRLWLTIGALGRLRYVLVSPLFIELTAGLGVPLLRDRFFFEPSSTVFQPPVLFGYASGGIGITIL